MFDQIATPSDARREYAYNAGMDDPTRAWIIAPWDTWEANPHYVGPKVRHPEDDSDDAPQAEISGVVTYDDIPF